MTPSNHRITRALALLMFAGAVTALAVPANAQTLDKALAVQGQADKAAAESQKRINEIRDRTQDAASRYATALADSESLETVSYTHLRAHETVLDLVCRLLLEKKTP